jgi:CheY-like chemotaxis protein
LLSPGVDAVRIVCDFNFVNPLGCYQPGRKRGTGKFAWFRNRQLDYLRVGNMANEKILIVDDDSDLTEALKTTLESANYTVSTAEERAEGIEKIRIEKPDLVILDVMMSTWQDGFEMSRDLKKDPTYKDIPILLLTAIADKTGISFKSDAGDTAWLPVDGYLDKPVEPRVLLAEVEKLLSKKI